MDFTSAPARADLATVAELHVTVLYDEPDSARAALHLVDDLARCLQGELPVARTLWRFNVLGLPMHELQTEANASDVVIVAASDPTGLPASVDAWLENWSAEHEPGTAALVGLLRFPTTVPPGDCAALQHLETVAHRSGQHFFASTLAARTSNSPPVEREQPARLPTPRPPFTFDIPDEADTRPTRRWGLNE